LYPFVIELKKYGQLWSERNPTTPQVKHDAKANRLKATSARGEAGTTTDHLTCRVL